jgi:integrase
VSITVRTTAKGERRYDAVVRGPDGKERSKTFTSRKAAEQHERAQRVALDKGAWIDPRHAALNFGDYATGWLSDRHDLQPRTDELYKGLLRLHVLPTFGALSLGKVTSTDVRAWHAALARKHPVTAAKAYRLLKQILATAVSDDLIGKNPCVVKGAGQERSPERPTASMPEVAALADAMPDRLRLAVELAAWCQLRRAELLGLERRDVDLLHGTIRVDRTGNLVGGALVIGPPKTEAGSRTISVPRHVLPALEHHLAEYVDTDSGSPLFVGERGGRASVRNAVQKAFTAAAASIGPDLHLHDLRHSGATWASVAGATTKEVMGRLGHASPRAALIYQHRTQDRDAAIAELLSGLAERADVVPISSASRDTRGMDASQASTSATPSSR